jgi:hypothetical protein
VWDSANRNTALHSTVLEVTEQLQQVLDEAPWAPGEVFVYDSDPVANVGPYETVITKTALVVLLDPTKAKVGDLVRIDKVPRNPMGHYALAIQRPLPLFRVRPLDDASPLDAHVRYDMFEFIVDQFRRAGGDIVEVWRRLS